MGSCVHCLPNLSLQLHVWRRSLVQAALLQRLLLGFIWSWTLLPPTPYQPKMKELPVTLCSPLCPSASEEVAFPPLKDRRDDPVARWPVCKWKRLFLPSWKIEDELSLPRITDRKAISPSSEQFSWEHDLLLIHVGIVGWLSCWSPFPAAGTVAALSARHGVSNWERAFLLLVWEVLWGSCTHCVLCLVSP